MATVSKVFETIELAEESRGEKERIFKVERDGTTFYVAARDAHRARTAVSIYSGDSVELLDGAGPKVKGEALLKAIDKATPEELERIKAILEAKGLGAAA